MVQEFKSLKDGKTYRLFAEDLTQEQADDKAAGVPKYLKTKQHKYTICGEERVALYIQI